MSKNKKGASILLVVVTIIIIVVVSFIFIVGLGFIRSDKLDDKFYKTLENLEPIEYSENTSFTYKTMNNEYDKDSILNAPFDTEVKIINVFGTVSNLYINHNGTSYKGHISKNEVNITDDKGQNIIFNVDLNVSRNNGTNLVYEELKSDTYSINGVQKTFTENDTYKQLKSDILDGYGNAVRFYNGEIFVMHMLYYFNAKIEDIEDFGVNKSVPSFYYDKNNNNIRLIYTSDDTKYGVANINEYKINNNHMVEKLQVYCDEEDLCYKVKYSVTE